MTTRQRRHAAISVSGLRSQAALLTFGEALEARLASADVRLVRAKGSSGVFTADVVSDAELTRALADVPGFDVLSSVHPSGRDASLTLAEVVAREASSSPWAVLDAAPTSTPTPLRPGEPVAIALSAHPLGSFRHVGDFRDAVRELPGVRAVTVVRFYRGSLQLRVDYDDSLPLAERLRSLEGFLAGTVTEEDARAIDMAIGG